MRGGGCRSRLLGVDRAGSQQREGEQKGGVFHGFWAKTLFLQRDILEQGGGLCLGGRGYLDIGHHVASRVLLRGHLWRQGKRHDRHCKHDGAE